MRDGSLRLVAALAAALSLFVPATIAGAALNDVGTVTAATGAYDETATAWFVELRGAPTAKGGNTDALRAEHAAFKAAAKSEGVSLTERYDFTAAWNGLSVRVARGQAAKLAACPA